MTKQAFPVPFVQRVSAHQKVLIAVANGAAAKPWEAVAKPPTREQFSGELSAFRRAKSGAFVLVSRVDGIDLPHDTCRVMLIEGLPTGSGLLDRYQTEMLHMSNLHAARIANRVVQLFGRINRGRNDYGAFLINGKDVNAWLNNDRYVALLPELLQKQILLGRHVQASMEVTVESKVSEVLENVLGRNPTWLEYYRAWIDGMQLDNEDVRRTDEVERRLAAAALVEAQVALQMWEGRFDEAWRTLDGTIEDTARGDTKLAGWHNLWLGYFLERSGDLDAARLSYERARARLGRNLILPFRAAATDKAKTENTSEFARFVTALVSGDSWDTWRSEMRHLKTRLGALDGASSGKMEEAFRELGEALGFDSTRPDNEAKTGPDVLWVDDRDRVCLAFELKTDKDAPAVYFKKEIAQGHDHLSWIEENQAGYACLGLVYIGPDGSVDAAANPSPEMWIAGAEVAVALRAELLALLDDLRNTTPADRSERIARDTGDAKWRLESIAARFKTRALKELKAPNR